MGSHIAKASRGWTLQELIAPERVLFYNEDWIGCGSRNDYDPGSYLKHSFQDRSEEIAMITHVDPAPLKLTKRKDIKRRLDSIPACQKMSWASDRKTTKDEDMAYCLIGIFDIPHMYWKRGEGRRAFIRLQEEIIKQSNDLSLFAWKLSDDRAHSCIDDNYIVVDDLRKIAREDNPFFDSSLKSSLHGVFACGPCHFRNATKIESTQPVVYNDEITITSRGVRISTPLLGSDPFSPFRTPLYCIDGDKSKSISIELRLLGGSVYARTNCTQLPELQQNFKGIVSQDEVYLANKIHRFEPYIGTLHRHAIRVPDSLLNLRRITVSPGYLWSNDHKLIVTNGRRFFVGSATYQDPRPGMPTEAKLLFGLDDMLRPWCCFSHVDSSFEAQPLESRKSYLERVWRPASRHSTAAYCDDPKTYVIRSRDENISGSVSIARRTYEDEEIFEVEFSQPVATPRIEWYNGFLPDYVRPIGHATTPEFNLQGISHDYDPDCFPYISKDGQGFPQEELPGKSMDAVDNGFVPYYDLPSIQGADIPTAQPNVRANLRSKRARPGDFAALEKPAKKTILNAIDPSRNRLGRIRS